MPQQTARQTNLRMLRREVPPPPRRRPAGLKLILGALAGLGFLIAAIGIYRNQPIAYETVPLSQGAVEITHAVDGLVARHEQVYTAPAAGMVARLVAEGQRVRVGAAIAQIVAADSAAPAPAPVTQPAGNGTTQQQVDQLTVAIFAKATAINTAKANGDFETADLLQAELDELSVRQQELAAQIGRSQPVVTAPPSHPVAQTQGPVLGEITATVAGLVIYQTDGLESSLAAGREGEWKPSLLSSLSAMPRAAPQAVAKGDPVLKVVDNLSLSLLVVVPQTAMKDLGESDRLSVRFTGRDGPPVTARIIRRVPEGESLLLVLSAPVFPEELVHQRRFRATLLLGSYEGLVVPRTAIDVRDGLQGVWVLAGIETRFHPVRVIGGNADLLALETDLQPGTAVLKHAPTWMR